MRLWVFWVFWEFLYAYPTIPTFSGTAGPDAELEGIERRNTMDVRTLGRTMYFCLFS